MKFIRRLIGGDDQFEDMIALATKLGFELVDHPSVFNLFTSNIKLLSVTNEDKKLIEEVKLNVPELTRLQQDFLSSMTEERFWKIFITIFRQQLSLMNFWDSSSQSQTALGHTYNEEEKDEIWRERIYTIVQQLAIAKTSDKTAETKEEDKQSTRTKPENKGVQQSIPRKKPTRVISVYCTLCKSKFGSQEEYQAHLDKCTRNISTLQIALTPVVPHKKISELNHNEWRTAENVVLSRMLSHHLGMIESVRDKVRIGVPSTGRRNLWISVSGCERYLKSDDEFYERSLQELKEAGISTDLLYPFDNLSFKFADHDLDEKQTADVKSILAILHHRLPSSAYLPYLPDMACTIRSVCDTAQTCAICWIMAKNAIDERTFALPASYSEFESYQTAFGALFKAKCPSMATRFAKRGIGVGELFDEWLQRLFVGYFPPKIVRRMFDFILCDGIEAVCRFGVTMLGLLPPDFFESKKGDDETDVWDSYSCYTAIQEYSRKIEFTKFFDVACTYSFPVVTSHSQSQEVESNSAAASADATQFYYDDIFLPENPSALLSDANFAQLWSFLPLRYSAKDAVRRYYTGDDGFSFHHLVEVCDAETPLLLIIRSLDQCIFGAYLSDPLVPRRGKYFGTGEAFLFSLSPKAVKYPWASHGPGYFILLEHNFFAVGGGNGYGLTLDEELHFGTTECCDTFQNEPLNGGKTKFECSQVEVLGFVDDYL